MPKVKPPTKKELLARGFSERTARDLIEICKEMNKLTDAEQQMVLAQIISRYLHSTPPRAAEPATPSEASTAPPRN